MYLNLFFFQNFSFLKTNIFKLLLVHKFILSIDWSYGLAVMTSPLQGENQRFESA